MLVLYTVGFSEGYIKDDVFYTKRFVELFWKQDMQQYQSHIEVIGNRKHVAVSLHHADCKSNKNIKGTTNERQNY